MAHLKDFYIYLKCISYIMYLEDQKNEMVSSQGGGKLIWIN